MTARKPSINLWPAILRKLRAERGLTQVAAAKENFHFVVDHANN